MRFDHVRHRCAGETRGETQTETRETGTEHFRISMHKMRKTSVARASSPAASAVQPPLARLQQRQQPRTVVRSVPVIIEVDLLSPGNTRAQTRNHESGRILATVARGHRGRRRRGVLRAAPLHGARQSRFRSGELARGDGRAAPPRRARLRDFQHAGVRSRNAGGRARAGGHRRSRRRRHHRAGPGNCQAGRRDRARSGDLTPARR